MISCTTTTDSSRSLPGAQDKTISPNLFFLRPFMRLTVAMLMLAICPSGLAIASYDRNPAHLDPYIFNKKVYRPLSSATNYSETGLASWYGRDFHGRRTSSGERYDMHAMTAAHKLLPMNTLLLVKNLENGRETIVRVNDRGPFSGKRIIDLSQSAAKALKLMANGTARVKVTILPKKESSQEIGEEPRQQPLALTSDEFFIQVGAFSREKNAARLQQRFTKSGYTAVIRKATGKKATIYRVLVSAGKEMDKAFIAEKSMRSNGYRGAFVVVR